MEFTSVGKFVYDRTYKTSKDKDWKDTVKRAVDFNCSLAKTYKGEEKELYDAIYNFDGFLSGRTLWIAGRSENLGLANFNCTGTVIEKFDDFIELFYLLMLGSGVGFRIFPEDVKKLPNVRKININHFYDKEKWIKQEDIQENTSFINNTIIVGDSKEGWKDALKIYFDIITLEEYKNIDSITIDYSSVRPKGEPIKHFGGTASGPGSLRIMFEKINKVTNNRNKLKPIDCLDIGTIIGENVVSGGVRRTALIALFDKNDNEILNAKKDLYTMNEKGEFIKNPEICHRSNSNNSIIFWEKPTKEEINNIIDSIRNNYEPGFINGEHAKKRKANFETTNPCGEILLDNKQTCNLTSLNVMSFVEDNKLNIDKMLKTMKLISRANLRMTLVKLELESWQQMANKDRICGVSITGWQDMVSAVNLPKTAEIDLLETLRAYSHKSVAEYSEELGIKPPKLITTVKPEGTQSLMPTVSPGVHYSYAPYYIRRVRISATDPLVKELKSSGWNLIPESGQNPENPYTYVLEFPVKSTAKKSLRDVSAIEQLENYKMFMEHYVDHNASVTISVKDNEWEQVKEWIYENWDYIVGISLMSYSADSYPLMPLEEISKERYEEMLKNTPKEKKISFNVLNNNIISDIECESGHCPVR